MKINNPTQRKDYKQKIDSIREMRGRTKIDGTTADLDMRATMTNKSKDS